MNYAQNCADMRHSIARLPDSSTRLVRRYSVWHKSTHTGIANVHTKNPLSLRQQQKKSNNMGAIELDKHCRRRPEGKCDSIFIIHLLGVPIGCIEFLYKNSVRQNTSKKGLAFFVETGFDGESLYTFYLVGL